MEKTKKRIGMIVAVEIAAVMKKYADKLEDYPARGFEVKRLVSEEYELYIVNSGAGEIASASAAQFLISEIGVDLIVNFGVVGGLTPEMTVAKLAIVTDVVHYDYDVSEYIGYRKAQYANYPSVYIPATRSLVDAALAIEPGLKPVICASGDKFIGNPDRKWALHEEYNADICEMEAAGIVLTANRSGVPCLLIKAVSDSMGGGAEEFAAEFERCASICLDTVDKIIRTVLISE
ncbi:MAG: 5'-methylthioadenosine/S-adenosylhomocysteine nucleosidase [Clostridia bacterium]|nr:5'-methylthioadenosine/S-adenosylhomocysteine nucleosidase [Clostridia bacterium]